jgi:hypothetical protein
MVIERKAVLTVDLEEFRLNDFPELNGLSAIQRRAQGPWRAFLCKVFQKHYVSDASNELLTQFITTFLRAPSSISAANRRAKLYF